MTIFTSEENKPTEFTLRLIRQMAYTYRVARIRWSRYPLHAQLMAQVDVSWAIHENV